MPVRPPSPCTHPGCPVLVDGGGRCATHKAMARRESDRVRGTATQRGYDHRWQRKRRPFLARHTVCVDCGARATVADHDPYTRRELVAMGVDDPDRDEYLQPRCTSCHNRRTALTSTNAIRKGKRNT